MELVKVFELLPPELLPSNSEQIVVNDICNKALSSVLQANGGDRTTAASNALLLFGDTQSRFSPLENDSNETQYNRDNDSEFNIIRVQGDTMEVLIYSALNAYRIMLVDMAFSGTSLNERYFNVLQKAFYALFHFYQGSTFACEKHCYPRKTDFNFSDYCDENDSYRRWVNAHFVFMAIIQGLVVSLNCYSSEVDRRQFSCADVHMRRAALLMQATEAAMHYTGEFSQQAYTRRVRPTLVPPIAKPNMSGVHWRDHEYMVKNNFVRLKRYFRTSDEKNVGSVTQFKDAINKAYTAHKLVCRKFVGDEQSSLLSTAPAVSVLEKYKNVRLKIFAEQKENR